MRASSDSDDPVASGTEVGAADGPLNLEHLMGAVMAGEVHALARLYALTVRQVFSAAHFQLRSKEDAEEVVLDVFHHVWKNAHMYDVSRGSVRAWLSIIAKNRAIDRLRQRRMSVPFEDEGGDILSEFLAGSALGPEQMLTLGESRAAVGAALQCLSQERRTLVQRAFFEGQTHDEISVALGMPLGTVKSHIRRALTAMQRHLLSHA